MSAAPNIIQNNIKKIALRAKFYAAIREYFQNNQVLEVHTPILSNKGITDIHVRAFQVKSDFHAAYWLHTSPEIAMKKLLSAGSGCIYQIASVFRDGGEFGRYHRPEFAMLEWYRVDYNLAQLQINIIDLINFLLKKLNIAIKLKINNIQEITYSDAFFQYTNINIWECGLEILDDFCQKNNLITIDNNSNQFNKDEYVDLIMGAYISPKLGHQSPVFLTQYPANQAALAKLNPDDPRTAQRCELYWYGIELANAYNELNDPIEQQARFTQEQKLRAELNLPEVHYDHEFIHALKNLPDCSGVALGLDRLLMIFDGLLANNLDFNIKNILFFE